MKFIDRNGKIHRTIFGALFGIGGEAPSSNFVIPTVDEVKEVLKDKEVPFIVDYKDEDIPDVKIGEDLKPVNTEDGEKLEITKNYILTSKTVHIHGDDRIVQFINPNGEITLVTNINDGVILPDLQGTLVGTIFFHKESTITIDDFMREYKTKYEDVYSQAEGNPIGNIDYVRKIYGIKESDMDELVTNIIDMVTDAQALDPFQAIINSNIVSKEIREYIKSKIYTESE